MSYNKVAQETEMDGFEASRRNRQILGYVFDDELVSLCVASYGDKLQLLLKACLGTNVSLHVC